MPHPLNVPKYALEQIRAKRKNLHVFSVFDPKKTALLVIDMQNFFIDRVTMAKSILPNINRLAKIVRERGGTIVWIATTLADEKGAASKWPIYHDYFFSEANMKVHKDGLTVGSFGEALHSDLDINADDLIVRKIRFSALIQGSSDLDAQLRGRGIENLLICGTLTNMCCESTGRDAMMIGYRVIMVHDANAARCDEEHTAGLASFWENFGDVRSTDDVIENVIVTNTASNKPTTVE